MTAVAVRERANLHTRKGKTWPTVILMIGALYCLVPVIWVFAAMTKSPSELFTTFSFLPGSGALDNLGDLFSYGG